MSAVIDVNEREFDTLLASQEQPVLVDFSAAWCGPCRAMAPALEAYAARRGSDLKVVKVDIDKAPAIANRYQVRAVPTIMLFQGGKPVATQPGMMTEGQLAAFVEQHAPPRPRRTAEQDPTRPQVDLDW